MNINNLSNFIKNNLKNKFKSQGTWVTLINKIYAKLFSLLYHFLSWVNINNIDLMYIIKINSFDYSFINCSEHLILSANIQ